MENLTLPEPNIDVMITYKKEFKRGETTHKEVVTKRGFYSKSFNNFAIPPSYQKFNGVLLPHGWGGDHISADQIIKWEYCKNN